jgi:hypothetical protein
MASRDPEKSSENSGEVVGGILESRRKLFLNGHAILALFLLLWPWIFAGVLWRNHDQGGIRASAHISYLVLNHPHAVDFFVTAISGVIAAIMTHVFTTAVMCIYLDRPIHGTNKFITRFYHHLKRSPSALPVAEIWRVVRNNDKSLMLLFTLVSFSLIFTVVGPGFNAILIPHPFIRNASLRGTELDFSSTNANCTAWINSIVFGDCNWNVSAIDIHLNNVS